MKTRLLIAFMLLCGAAFAQDSVFTIKGTLSELKEGTLHLNYYADNRYYNDSAVISNGNFSFTGILHDLSNATIFRKGDKAPLQFILEPGEMTLTGKGDSLKNLEIGGSTVTKEVMMLTQMIAPANQHEAAVAKMYEEAMKTGKTAVADSLIKLRKTIADEKKKAVGDFVTLYPNSLLSSQILLSTYSYNVDLPELEKAYNLLTPRAKATPSAALLVKLIEGNRQTAIGTKLSDIKQADTSGKMKSFTAFKEKYVLIDFWASWCGPCRAENPNIVKAYAKYHPKGLEIFAVSYDDKADKWKKAILADKLPWTHVSDLKGWMNETSERFYIKSIPSNILLDKNGKVIAKNIFGEELTEKLKELMP